MTRILLLILFVIWLAWTPDRPMSGADVAGILLFISFYVLLLCMLALWARLLARRVRDDNFQFSLKRFNRVIGAARWLIPAWFAYGVFHLGWGNAVHGFIGGAFGPLQVPSMLAGTAPALLAWMGLWWAEYPANRALREQNLLAALDMDLPVHVTPGFRSYFTANVRLQLLFTLVPILLIFALRDTAVLLHGAIGYGWDLSMTMESLVTLASTALIFLVAPEILRRVLHTQRLPDSPLRRRLEALCRRHRLGYREILLWRTHSNMGNAAVMGLLPPVRYILLSDLLLETMTDRQIEAVFAHEVGHVVHRHMAWYLILFVTFLVALSVPGPGELLEGLMGLFAISDRATEYIAPFIAIGGFLLVFGYLSRRFERQADVFAARTLQSEFQPTDQLLNLLDAPASTSGAAASSHVGEYGATIFTSALHRVALINNIPVAGRNWTHGSIADRMRHLRDLSADPARTRRFDRAMIGIYATVLLIFFACSFWTVAARWSAMSDSRGQAPGPVLPYEA